MTAAITQGHCPPTRDSMRIPGAAHDFLDSAEDFVNPSVAFAAWRADCYAELAAKYAGHVNLADLLAAWGQAFDSVQPNGLTPEEMDLLKAYRLRTNGARASFATRRVKPKTGHATHSQWRIRLTQVPYAELERVTAAFQAMNPVGCKFLRKIAEGS